MSGLFTSWASPAAARPIVASRSSTCTLSSPSRWACSARRRPVTSRPRPVTPTIRPAPSRIGAQRLSKTTGPKTLSVAKDSPASARWKSAIVSGKPA
ncbi:MAG: hypothetical protein QM704_07495 [Anaeromyxobacteraceae bacterium]